jgi:hypothetical protein
MQSNEIIPQQVFQVVEKQQKFNNLPETPQTYNQLQSSTSNADARMYIGQCVTAELFYIMKDRPSFIFLYHPGF